MATYVNDLRLTELATGEGSGTWGTTTNQSLELIGEALGYATQQAFGSDADATTTVADGASDPARAMYYKITSAASLTATRTLTIAPNTISRVMFIENATSGSQSIAISQGSGASVTILSGKTAVVYLDGAGATAAVVDAMAGVDPGVTDTLTEVLVAGNTSGGTNIELSTTDKVQFRDAAIYINSSVDGQLDIVADTEIQIAATTIDINGAINASGEIIAASLDISGDIDVAGTTNLDVVDIDGAVDMASTLGVTGVATLASLVATTADINAGTIDNTVIGGATAAAISGTTGQFATSLNVDGTVTADGLVVDGASSGSTVATFTANANVDTPLLVFQRTGGAVAGKIAYDDTNTAIAFGTTTNHEVRFLTNNTEKMQLTADGNVGIGVTPTEKLDISQSVNNSVIAKVTNTNSGDLASARVEVHNDDSSFGQLTTYSSGFDFNVLGSNAANWTFLGASGSNSNGLKIGTLTADPVVFGTSDLERMRIDASGNVGIGTSSPSLENGSGLVIYNASAPRISLKNSTSGTTGLDGVDIAMVSSNAYFHNREAGAVIIGTTGLERMRIDASGNVGINVISPADTFGGSGTLDAAGPLLSRGQIGQHQTNAGVLQYGSNVTTIRSYGATSGSGIIAFNTGGGGAADTERMRIDASGNLLVGTTSQGYGLFSASRVTLGDGDAGDGFCVGGINENLSAYTVQADNDTGTRYFAYIANGSSSVVGTISFTSSGTGYNTSSDQRLKENIEDADDAGSKIDAIQVRKFDWKVDGSHQDYGMVAQELQVVAPEAVSAPEDPEEMMGVDYSKLVPMMLKEIQSLRARINALEAE
jgi:hypothetical protein